MATTALTSGAEAVGEEGRLSFCQRSKEDEEVDGERRSSCAGVDEEEEDAGLRRPSCGIGGADELGRGSSVRRRLG